MQFLNLLHLRQTNPVFGREWNSIKDEWCIDTCTKHIFQSFDLFSKENLDEQTITSSLYSDLYKF